MAAFIRISISPSSILIHQKPAVPVKRRTRMIAHSTGHDIHLQTTPLLQIRSSIKLHKVFEDRSSGVVCYRDEKGEITCEGYDEGPRFHQMFSTLTSDQSLSAHYEIVIRAITYGFRTASPSFMLLSLINGDAEVIELLHRRLLQIVDKSGAKNGAAEKDDFNSSNGFNALY